MSQFGQKQMFWREMLPVRKKETHSYWHFDRLGKTLIGSRLEMTQIVDGTISGQRQIFCDLIGSDGRSGFHLQWLQSEVVLCSLCRRQLLAIRDFWKMRLKSHKTSIFRAKLWKLNWVHPWTEPATYQDILCNSGVGRRNPPPIVPDREHRFVSGLFSFCAEKIAIRKQPHLQVK